MITKQSCNTSDVLIWQSPSLSRGREVPLLMQGTNRFPYSIVPPTIYHINRQYATIIVDLGGIPQQKCDILTTYDLKKRLEQ